MSRKYTSVHKAAFRDDIALSTLASMPTVTNAAVLVQCGGNSRRLYRFMHSLVQRRKSACLPQNHDTQELATCFANFFSAKIEMIRATVCNNSAVTPSLDADEQQSPSVPRVHTFATALISDIRKLITKSPTTSRALDPLPTWLLKHVADGLAPFLTQFINCSISSGVVPRCMKCADVTRS